MKQEDFQRFIDFIDDINQNPMIDTIIKPNPQNSEELRYYKFTLEPCGEYVLGQEISIRDMLQICGRQYLIKLLDNTQDKTDSSSSSDLADASAAPDRADSSSSSDSSLLGGESNSG